LCPRGLDSPTTPRPRTLGPPYESGSVTPETGGSDSLGDVSPTGKGSSLAGGVGPAGSPNKVAAARSSVLVASESSGPNAWEPAHSGRPWPFRSGDRASARRSLIEAEAEPASLVGSFARRAPIFPQRPNAAERELQAGRSDSARKVLWCNDLQAGRQLSAFRASASRPALHGTHHHAESGPLWAWRFSPEDRDRTHLRYGYSRLFGSKGGDGLLVPGGTAPIPCRKCAPGWNRRATLEQTRKGTLSAYRAEVATDGRHSKSFSIQCFAGR